MNPGCPSVAQRAGHRCEYCRAPEAIFNFPFEVEHTTPVAQHGPDDENNLALACRSCNIHKSDHTTGEDPTTLTTVRSFNPRQDHWDERLRVEQATGEVIRVTPIGRATVARLRMNTPGQVQARRLWMTLGLFP
jgi:hypothetical protein